MLAIPVLGIFAWLGFGWPTGIRVHDLFSNHEVVALIALMGGTYLLTLGTRATLRIGLPLLLALTAMPSLAGHRSVPVAVVVVAAVAVAVAVRLRAHRRDEAATRATAAPAVGITTRSRRADDWPPVRLATGLTALAAVALGARTAMLVVQATPPHRVPVTAVAAPRPPLRGDAPSGSTPGTAGGAVTAPNHASTGPSPTAAPSPSTLLGRVIRPKVLGTP